MSEQYFEITGKIWKNCSTLFNPYKMSVHSAEHRKDSVGSIGEKAFGKWTKIPIKYIFANVWSIHSFCKLEQNLEKKVQPSEFTNAKPSFKRRLKINPVVWEKKHLTKLLNSTLQSFVLLIGTYFVRRNELNLYHPRYSRLPIQR